LSLGTKRHLTKPFVAFTVHPKTLEVDNLEPVGDGRRPWQSRGQLLSDAHWSIVGGW